MPLFYQQDINATTKLAVWKIEEEEAFFTAKVPLHKEITHPHKRLQHLAGRYLLRFLFPDFPNEEILIASTRKPFLRDEKYHFSISHCGDYAAAIVSKTERVGIDIEIETPKVSRIAHKFLNEEERETVDRQPSAVNSLHTGDFSPPDSYRVTTQHSLLTLLWCAKETVYKWWGHGEVDFKEHIRLSSFLLQPEGSFTGVFAKCERPKQLNIHYRFFDHLCLAFTHN